MVDDYLAGLSVGYLAQKYGVHRATVSKHLTRNKVVRRQQGLTIEEAAEAVGSAARIGDSSSHAASATALDLLCNPSDFDRTFFDRRTAK
ncbi:hypothetical protein GCM10025863_09940 [Microbacterium suwonense]|uniref:HTH psq-type domain-containing protein n=1 Tax=Microbacterium suwonense TaxID=683047 RepID=A0ABN6X0Z2_9MICO|nr:hypothetical protein GCM10025863_09940 [Microbacterium suwonense]